jgi:PAS domain S-box-containing protein
MVSSPPFEKEQQPIGSSLAAVRSLFRRWAPPIHRPEFWVVQVLVISIAVGHGLVEASETLHLGSASFVPVSLFLIPVVYAALTFGARGAIPTALWSALLTVPNVVLWHGWQEALPELWQVALVVAVGFFAGHRVDRERQARHEAERREQERLASEAKYRGLFDLAADATLLLDESGRILEANTAAASLFGRAAGELGGRDLASLSPEIADATHRGDGVRVVGPLVMGPGGRAVWIDPVQIPFRDARGERRILAQLRDVTLQAERQELLEHYARRILDAREEERRRIARELHDGPLQSLVLLWRSLDHVRLAPTAEAAEVLDESRRTAEEVAVELRQFSRDLRPSVLDDLGLVAALKAEAAAMGQRTGIAVRCMATSAASHVRLSPEVELTMLRIVQEALHNIERHASARQVTIRLTLRGAYARLAISDDGRGVADLPTTRELIASGRLGIVGMQERARLIGASCAVRPLPSGGTRVEVVAPV